MQTFDDEKLIEGFYIVQYLLQHSPYSDKSTSFGQHHLKLYYDLIELLEKRNFKIQNNEKVSYDFLDLGRTKLYNIVIDENNEIIRPTNHVDEVAMKTIRFLEAYSIKTV